MTMTTDVMWVRYIFTNEENTVLAQQMARAEAVISEKADTLRSVSASIKAEIATQEGILHSCAEKLRSGYEMRPQEVDLKYDYQNAVIQKLDKITGEILEERPMTKDEQLKLVETNVPGTDAEDIIRQASAEEDDSFAQQGSEEEE